MVKMPMMSSSGISRQILPMVRRLKDGYKIELMTFKKDRGMEISKLNSAIMLKEFGFKNETSELDMGSFEKAFKDAYWREFPRSHEVRYSIKKQSP